MSVHAKTELEKHVYIILHSLVRRLKERLYIVYAARSDLV